MLHIWKTETFSKYKVGKFIPNLSSVVPIISVTLVPLPQLALQDNLNVKIP